jgi:hypothetical protein
MNDVEYQMIEGFVACCGFLIGVILAYIYLVRKK